MAPRKPFSQQLQPLRFADSLARNHPQSDLRRRTVKRRPQQQSATVRNRQQSRRALTPAAFSDSTSDA